jgi:Transposase DDE domain
MNFNKLANWLSTHVSVKYRLRLVCLWYLLFLMISTRKHSLQEAARFSGINTSQFSKFLKNHSELAILSLHDLSKKQAKQFSNVMNYLANNTLPWKIAILIDSTIQHRSSLHTDNSKRFNHGKGFVIGHQWTNIVIIINDVLIPLPPIPFYSKNYCRKNRLEYKTENELVIEYINKLNLEDYIGSHNPREVLVAADSGYDDKNIENTIADKKWQFIIALKKTRSVKSESKYSNTPKSKGWSQIAQFFKNHRRIKWQTVRVPTNSAKRKRMEFRIRQIIGYLRYVGKVQLICSEFRKRPDGRRKYLVCNDLKAKARHILIGYRIRWAIEIFHKKVKMFLGFEEVAPKWFTSVVSHVHWVYCAYILLQFNPPGVPEHINSLADKQRWIKTIIDGKEKVRVFQLLTQINGTQRYKNELRQAFEAI